MKFMVDLPPVFHRFKGRLGRWIETHEDFPIINGKPAALIDWLSILFTRVSFAATLDECAIMFEMIQKIYTARRKKILHTYIQKHVSKRKLMVDG